MAGQQKYRMLVSIASVEGWAYVVGQEVVGGDHYGADVVYQPTLDGFIAAGHAEPVVTDEPAGADEPAEEPEEEAGAGAAEEDEAESADEAGADEEEGDGEIEAADAAPTETASKPKPRRRRKSQKKED